jgi:transposase
MWNSPNRSSMGEARSKENFSDVGESGLDETSRKKGHEYITLVADIQKIQK